MSKTEKELLELYRDRLKDRAHSKGKRRRQGEGLPHRMGDLLENYFKEDPSALRKVEEARAILAWEKLVGAAAARVSQAQRIRGDTLIVRVTDPLWMQQLSLFKQDLLAKYRSAFPRLGLAQIFFTRN